MGPLAGRRRELSEKLPFLPVTEALDALSRIEDGALLAGALAAIPAYAKAEAVRLLPQLQPPDDAPEDQLREAHQRDLDIEAAEGVHFERAWLDPESGMVFYLSTGPSKEAVRRVHDKAGHPADEIYELPVEV